MAKEVEASIVEESCNSRKSPDQVEATYLGNGEENIVSEKLDTDVSLKSTLCCKTFSEIEAEPSSVSQSDAIIEASLSKGDDTISEKFNNDTLISETEADRVDVAKVNAISAVSKDTLVNTITDVRKDGPGSKYEGKIEVATQVSRNKPFQTSIGTLTEFAFNRNEAATKSDASTSASDLSINLTIKQYLDILQKLKENALSYDCNSTDHFRAQKSFPITTVFPFYGIGISPILQKTVATVPQIPPECGMNTQAEIKPKSRSTYDHIMPKANNRPKTESKKVDKSNSSKSGFIFIPAVNTPTKASQRIVISFTNKDKKDKFKQVRSSQATPRTKEKSKRVSNSNNSKPQNPEDKDAIQSESEPSLMSRVSVVTITEGADNAGVPRRKPSNPTSSSTNKRKRSTPTAEKLSNLPNHFNKSNSKTEYIFVQDVSKWNRDVSSNFLSIYGSGNRMDLLSKFHRSHISAAASTRSTMSEFVSLTNLDIAEVEEYVEERTDVTFPRFKRRERRRRKAKVQKTTKKTTKVVQPVEASQSKKRSTLGKMFRFLKKKPKPVTAGEESEQQTQS